MINAKSNFVFNVDNDNVDARAVVSYSGTILLKSIIPFMEDSPPPPQLCDYVNKIINKFSKFNLVNLTNILSSILLLSLSFILNVNNNNTVYAKDNKQSCLIQKKENGKIEYNTKYGKNCTLLRPITLTDVNALTLDEEIKLSGACVLSSSELVYYVNVEKVTNRKIANNESYGVKCKPGYKTTDSKEFVYKCNDGNLTFDDENSTVDSDCVLKGCTESSPIYDKNNNKIADHLYGAMFGNNGNGKNYYTYQACFKNSNNGTKYTLNSSGSGFGGEVAPDEYIICGRSSSDLDEYKNELARKLTCINNKNNDEPYWKFIYGSCDLEELKNMRGVDVLLAYNGTENDLNSVMTSGAKQVRFAPYYYGNGDYKDGVYSELCATFNKVEGNSLDGTIKIKCGIDNKWKVESNGTIDYVYTGNVQTFTPKYYGVEGKKLTLEVWGAQGGGSNGGKGGYTIGYFNTNSNLSIYVGGRGGQPNGGYNGGGEGGTCCGGNCGAAFGGGGKSNIDLNGSSLIIAGGGGGSNEANINVGGYGGGFNGGDGSGKFKGEGGTQTAGGQEGNIENDSHTSTGGTKGLGGIGGGSVRTQGTFCGGGGGGGYYGGGGGDWALGNGDKDSGSGGGGSSYIGVVTGGNTIDNVQSGDGKARIAW